MISAIVMVKKETERRVMVPELNTTGREIDLVLRKLTDFEIDYDNGVVCSDDIKIDIRALRTVYEDDRTDATVDGFFTGRTIDNPLFDRDWVLTKGNWDGKNFI